MPAILLSPLSKYPTATNLPKSLNSIIQESNGLGECSSCKYSSHLSEVIKLIYSQYKAYNALKTQVNPHFLFNNLNTLCSIIPENPEQAVDFVQQLSKVYRHILEVKDEKSIPLKEEMAVLEAYAFLLKTRFGDNLEINMEVDPTKMEDMIVPLSLQLLMENAIKHNIVSQDKPLKIIVKVIDGNLVVTNNLQKKNQIIESTGIGLTNIRNRYKLIAFCYADGKLCFAIDRVNQKHLLEQNLSQLESQLEPTKFFRINRNLLVHIDAIKKVHTWLGGRLKLELTNPCSVETIVSRERVNDFKEWLGDDS